jgi:hypothetical protein
MNYVAFQSVLWIAAGFLLVILVTRRRKRRQASAQALPGETSAEN